MFIQDDNVIMLLDSELPQHQSSYLANAVDAMNHFKAVKEENHGENYWTL
jgi:hypothetical protein